MLTDKVQLPGCRAASESRHASSWLCPLRARCHKAVIEAKNENKPREPGTLSLPNPGTYLHPLCFPCLGNLFFFPSPIIKVEFAVRCRSPAAPSTSTAARQPHLPQRSAARGFISARCRAGNVSRILKHLLTFTSSHRVWRGQIPCKTWAVKMLFIFMGERKKNKTICY